MMTPGVVVKEIRGGIEWFDVLMPDGSIHHDECCCARCGSSAGWVDCGHCGGEGVVEVDDWENFDNGDEKTCTQCKGTGGTWHCISTPEWCAAHPAQGREQITSTALRAEAWGE